MTKENVISREPQKGERQDLFATFFDEGGIKEASGPITGEDEMKNEDEMPVTRADLLRYVCTGLYDRANFKYMTQPPQFIDEVDDILSVFRSLYASEPVHTIEIKRECLRKAYWEVYQSAHVSFWDFERQLIIWALEIMKSARFKKIMKKIGYDIDEDEMAWIYGWLFASHYVLYGSEVVFKFIRNRIGTRFKVDDACDEPMFDMKRIYEVIDSSDFHYMEDLLSFPGFFEEDDE